MTADTAVTGATGALGGLVAELLAADAHPQRLLVRDAARAPKLAGATVATMDYSDRASCTRALSGVSVVFLVSAPEGPNRLQQHRTVVDAAVTSGVAHVVYTSFLAAAPDSTFTLARDHAATERYIVESGLDFTFLRDNFYIDFMETLIDSTGVIRGPAGNGRVSIVARADIASAASAVLRAPESHRSRTYELTGREALTMADIAATISDVRKRPVSFVDETTDDAYRSRRHLRPPPWQLDAWVSTYSAIASGELSPVRPDLERLTGRPPMTLREFLNQTRSR